MASIIITTGDQKGNYYPLGKRTTVVGRDEGLLVQILDSKVSRKHMKIRYDNNSNNYHIMDMNSKHGVYVNDRQIKGETELKDHDFIAIGQTVILFTLKDFEDKQSALSHFKKVGERRKDTYESIHNQNY